MTQRQIGGRGSLNVQGTEVNLTVNESSLSAESAVGLIMQLSSANLIQMQGQAREIVDKRFEELATQFVNAAQLRRPGALESLRDPDVQYALLTAQRDYARSGSPALGDTLVDLLVARCVESTGSLRAIVLNEAINTVGRLTNTQLDLLTCSWVTTWLRQSELASLEDLAEWLRANLVPFVLDAPTPAMAYNHLMYCGCIQIGVLSEELGRVWGRTYPGLFGRSLVGNAIPESLREVPGLFVSSADDPQLLRFGPLEVEAVEDVVQKAGVPDLAGLASALLLESVRSADEVEQMVIELVPELTDFARRWRETPLGGIRLSTVGIALSHANWTRVVGDPAGLELWIGEEEE